MSFWQQLNKMIIPVFILTAFQKCKVQKYRLIDINSITTIYAIVISGQILDYKLQCMYKGAYHSAFNNEKL